jgi:hypothetical protein
MNILRTKTDSRAMIIHIAAGVTILIGLTSAMLLRLFIILPFLSLFYIPIIFVTWSLVLLLVIKTKIFTAILPGLWFFVLGLLMLAVSKTALIAFTMFIAPNETNIWYFSSIEWFVFDPGFWVASTGILLLLIGLGIRKLKNRKSSS